MTEQELYEMKLHHERIISEKTEVLRVVGGWVYMTASSNGNEFGYCLTSIFVPEPSLIDVLRK